MYQISRQNLLACIQKINQEHPILLTDGSEANFCYQYSETQKWNGKDFFFAPIRTAQPLKSVFYPAIQTVATYPAKSENESEDPKEETLVIIGPKACDINALKIIDAVYADGNFPDNQYVNARKNTIIISGDCTDAGENCYCNLLNYHPFPEKDFDLNLSPVDDQFIIEVGSSRGKVFFEKYFSGLQNADKELLQKREELRQAVNDKLVQQNSNFKYFTTHQESIEKHISSGVWGELSETCVECGICTQICPTCHCFQMFDLPDQERFNRIKIWDSCFFGGYSRMAGGLTPRLKLEDRFKNRFYHKFDSFVQNFGMEACTGCGRCVEGCMGKIDLREVLMELEKRVVLKEKIDLIQ